jgi:catechol 2,3-dioxygenase-like lactoylglutathione lyase family enzyme
MLGGKSVAPMLAVRDLQAARDFYENTLGLALVSEAPDALVFRSGESVAVVYQSEYSGTNQATAASWAVGDDLDEIVESLRANGIGFEHYDNLPGVTRQGDIHVGGGVRAAWFKDPDGNILNLIDQAM